MDDYNASLGAVDSAMAMLEAYRSELSDRRAANAFALADLQQAVDRTVYRCAAEADALRQENNATHRIPDATCRLQDRLESLQALQQRCTLTAAELLDAWNDRCSVCDQIAVKAFRDTGMYMKKLRFTPNSLPAGAVPTVIVDSLRYPQTAEHIRIARNRGLPDTVTIDRAGAAARRKASLAGKSSRSDFDRDEYPCAVFAEGGAGADVAYIKGSDNRGAGSALQWQIRTLPDGTRVRIRII